MERKKRSKGSVWEFCYAKKNFGTFGVEMRACGQKFVKFCTLTHTHTHTHTAAAKLVVRILTAPETAETIPSPSGGTYSSKKVPTTFTVQR